MADNSQHQWVKLIKRLHDAAFDVLGKDNLTFHSAEITAYVLVDSRGTPLTWAIPAGVGLPGALGEERQWRDLVDRVQRDASRVLSKNMNDGCAVVSVVVVVGIGEKLFGWRIGDLLRIEPSYAAADILKGLLGLVAK